MSNRQAKASSIVSFSVKQVPNLKYKKSFGLKKILNVFVVVAVVVAGFNFPFASSQAATTSSLAPVSVGNYDQFSASSGTKVNAVASNDGDSTYISETTNGDAQTFAFSGASVPANSTIDAVTVTALAKKSGNGNASIALRVEKGTGNANKNDDSSHGLGTNYAVVSRAMTTNPFTGIAWTLSEVNSWTSKFGVVMTNSGATARVTQLFVTVDYTTHTAPIANPTLSQACGLDVALVLDDSASISNSSLTSMKGAFTGFVNTFLPGTPTEFSVTKFNSVASVGQTFTGTAATANAAINGVTTSSGHTNWEDGLTKAFGTFDPRPGTSHPNLIIFASDGNPNRTVSSPNSDVSEAVAVEASVIKANSIKAAGTKIITLGVGLSGTSGEDNLKSISSASDFYSVANFGSLASTLQGIATSLCGGTINVAKLIDDGQGNQTPGAGWTFTVAGQTKVTDQTGQTASVTVGQDGSNYSVVETPQAGFTLQSASCTTDNVANGTSDIANKQVTGITVNSQKIVSCVFVNKVVVAPTPTVTPTDIPSPTPTPSDSPTPTPSDSPTPTPTDAPSPTPTDIPTPTPVDSPTPTPTPSVTPTDVPSPTPTPDNGGGGDNNPTNFTLTVDKSGPGNGTVTGAVSEGQDATFCDIDQCTQGSQEPFTQQYASGTEVTLTAHPDANSVFDGSWLGGPCDTSTNPICSFTMTGNISMTAHFNTASTGGGNGGGGNNFVSSGNGGGGGGAPAVILIPTPAPIVLGASTGVPSGSVAGGGSTPQPQVLGDSTTLPRTGTPVGFMFLVLASAAVLLNRKLKLV